MISEVNTRKGNPIYISSDEKTGAGEPQRDIFTHLYRDAEVKRQQRKQHYQQKEFVGAGRTHTRNEITPIAPQRSNSHLIDHDASTVLPGITPFATNKRINKLALPRGPNHTTISPPSPNYGRLINFTEEVAEENRRPHHHHISRHPPEVTIPTSNPRINRLATPKRYMESTSLSRKNSSLGQEERQEYQGTRRRSNTPLRRGLPVFRFK
ncbi:hypothetical protein LSM04_001266 [Trypanosoma melophagium]|uniref:uncharacterized protein n=1 Tax=Trypanosoma melophagium TaxID=715481 RepID=UPI00351AACDE|nr:hypothetical protein LSM04_001266 [Trypanosoma melophagium]